MKQELREMNGHNQMAIWSERVAACRSSGLSVTQWCNQEGINASSYYRWQRKLFEQLAAQEAVCFAELPMPQTRSTNVAATLNAGGIRIELSNSASTELIHSLVEALKSC